MGIDLTSSDVLWEIFGFASDTVPKSIHLLLTEGSIEILYGLCREIKNQAYQIHICL